MTARKIAPKPKSSRPFMEGYGVPKSMKGALSWEWARKRLTESHNYLIVTVRPGGAPHAMPIWGIWLDNAFYFSTAKTSRKARNLQKNKHCIICTENVAEAVIVEGMARSLATGNVPQQAFEKYKAKYAWELDPKLGPVIAVQPRAVFAMPEKQFPKAVTRWRFD